MIARVLARPLHELTPKGEEGTELEAGHGTENGVTRLLGWLAFSYD